jgi:hypothetical protein
MKHLAIALLNLSLLWPAAHAQNIPDAPASTPDPSWIRLQNLAMGEPIIVTATDNRSVHCLFAGVTDSYLFCNPAGNPPGVGFRFDRVEVVSVDLDRPGAATAQVHRPEHNYHPAWISSMLAGGLVVGFIASQNTHVGKAAQDGLIGAGVVGLIGAPLAFLPHPQMAPPGPVYPLYGIGVPLRVPVRSHGHRVPFFRAPR